jgi:hypothetical protein
MEFALKNAPTIKFTIQKLETVIASLDLEESRESAKFAQLEPLQEQMETVVLVELTNNWLMDNVFAPLDLFRTNLKYAQNAVKLLELSWSTELALFAPVNLLTTAKDVGAQPDSAKLVPHANKHARMMNLSMKMAFAMDAQSTK